MNRGLFLLRRACKYRTRHHLPVFGGFVVFYQDKACGWMAAPNEPEAWLPGCVAVSVEGSVFAAQGSNYQGGALEWNLLEGA